MSRQSTLSQTRSALLAPMVRLALTTFLALTAWIVLTSLASSSVPAQAQSSPCQLQVDKTASPSQLNLGEYASLELRVDSTCPRQSTPLRVVLAIDSSSSMEPDGKIQAARAAGLRFAELLDLPRDGLGVASFSDRAYEMVAVTGDRAAATAAIAAIRTRRGTDTESGLILAREMLERDRAQRAAGPASEAIVILSDGRPSTSDASVLAAAQAAKDAGVIIASACVGSDCDTGLMRRIASQPELFFDVPDPDALVSTFERVARRLVELRLLELRVTDRLPANMRYVPGSAQPAPESQSGDSLTWVLREPLPAPARIRLQVEPLQAGLWPTNASAFVQALDASGGQQSAVFPLPEVLVIAPLRPLYLPLLLRERCDPRAETLDVVLLLDLSTSMDGPTQAGGLSKREAARQAAEAFVSQLNLRPAGSGDQVAILGFHAQAAVLSPLGSSPGELRAVLAGLPRGQGTRIDLGLSLAREVLTGPGRRPANRPVILLLTDGRPSFEDEAGTLAAALAARTAGLDLYTVGLGADVNPALLRDLAGQPDRYFAAPKAEELSALYQRLASVIPCPGGRHDWGAAWP
jgi:Mg-chelatase subunit ChlD